MALLILASCGTPPNRSALSFASTNDPFKELLNEVSSNTWEIKESLPELKYAKDSIPRGPMFETNRLRDADGNKFQVLIINCPSMSFPGDDFMLAYLRDSKGKIVDWKSQWLYNRRGILKTKIFDANHDGIADFCFICKPFEGPEEIVSGVCVTKGRFTPVTLERTRFVEVDFSETMLEGGLVAQPQFKGRLSWRTDKIYELPVKIFNPTDKPIDLRGRYFDLDYANFYGSYHHNRLKNEVILPGETEEITFSIRCDAACPDGTFRFALKPEEKQS